MIGHYILLNINNRNSVLLTTKRKFETKEEISRERNEGGEKKPEKVEFTIY